MMRSLKLLPVTMLMAFLLLGLKVGEVMRDGRMILLSFQEAHAQQSNSTAPTPPAAATPPAAGAAAPAAATDTPKVTPPSTDSEDASEEQAPKHEFSQVEIDLLQSLAKRRQEQDEWAKQIQLKENMLIATEQRINDKIANLQALKTQVETLLDKYNEQEDTKIRSLVKIYENMNPKDAARIFEELDMPIMLTVVDRMKEKKVAPILAAMSPTRAKDLTVQLAEQRKLQKPGANNANGSPAGPAANPPPASGTGR
jgi:flagellar motility protein MotE (MotC chaperone)